MDKKYEHLLDVKPKMYASMVSIYPTDWHRSMRETLGHWPPMTEDYLAKLDKLDDDDLWVEHGVVRDTNYDPPYRYTFDYINGKPPPKYNEQRSRYTYAEAV